MAHGTHALQPNRHVRLSRLVRRLLLVLLVAAALVFTGLRYASSGTKPSPRRPVVITPAQVRPPDADALVLAGSAASVAVAAAHQLFASAPTVVVAADTPAALAAGSAAAGTMRAPLLLASPQATKGAGATGALTAGVRAEIGSLHPADVLAVGIPAHALARQLPRIRVVTTIKALPRTSQPAPLLGVAMLVHRGRPDAAAVAATATARAAGVMVIAARGDDTRADPAAITALAGLKPRQVLAVGAAFGPVSALAANVALAETGIQLPGGQQILFPGHRIVALYGNPGTPSLGALGEQGLSASIARIKRIAALYQPLSKVPVVPAFEIIATVAQQSAGPDGLYSYETPVAALRPWVRGAIDAGLYVVLDLQAGRASLLAQARLYQSLLRLPDVGLAIDPEWKLQPGQLPLKQIGSVSIAQVNSVVDWLAALTARYDLPQKLLVLHQFRLSMIQDEAQLDTRHSDLAIVIHMDGQGTPADKVQTWDAVTAAAPPGVFFGWKNFFVKDHPMLTPQETMDRSPQPVMISYQ